LRNKNQWTQIETSHTRENRQREMQAAKSRGWKRKNLVRKKPKIVGIHAMAIVIPLWFSKF